MTDQETAAGAAHLDYAEDRAAAARALDTTDTTTVTEPPTPVADTFDITVTVTMRRVAGPELDDDEVAARLAEEVEGLADLFIEAEGSDEESQYTVDSATYA